MATLSYSIRFGTGTWESINDICSGKEVAIVGNLCSNGFKSVADTASFVLRYTGSAHYVTVANSILTAQANNTDVFVRFQKVAGAILFEGKVDLDKLSIKSTKIPTELSLSAKDYTYELDEAPKVNVVYDQRTVKQIVDGLLDSSTTSTSRKSVHTWPSDGLENLVPDVPMVITTDDKTTYRQRIDVLLQEMGGYVLNLDPSDGYYKVRKVVNDTVITASSDAVNYMVTDALVTDRSLWTNDGLVIKYPTVVRETEKKLVYTYMPSLKDATDGEHVVGDEIEVNAFWPKDGDLKATYQEFDTQYVDTAYNTNETREQNADLDLYYVDPGTGTTPDIDMKMVVSDSDFNRVSNWYSLPAVPYIYKEAGIQMYPRKTWILLKNTSGKKLNLTHFEIKGKPVYRSRVNHLIAPVDCSDPYEYEASYVATQSRVEALAQFMYNLKANSSSVSKWTDKWDAHNLGDKVKVQHKGHGTNGMGWLTCFIAAKSMKMIGDELYAEYTAVAISGWTALPQADNHTTLTSTGNTQDAYSQWLAQGNTGTREEWIASMKGEDGKGISSVEVKYGKTDGYVSGGHSDVEHETSEARIKSLKVYGGDEVHGESATSGGVATVGTTEKGKAWLKKVEGKSVAIKNLAPQYPKDFFIGVNNGTKTVNSDNSVTFTASGASPNFYTSASWSFSACRLLVAAKIVASGAATAKFSINYVQSEATSISPSTDWVLGIISLGSAITNQRFYCNVTNATSGDTIQFTDIRVYSLTHMFGSGDEPTSTSDPRISLVKSFIEANPYNAGGLHSSTLSKVVSKGVNLCDEQFAQGHFEDGVYVASGTYLCSLSYIEVDPSKTYYLVAPSYDFMLFYDSSKNYLSQEARHNGRAFSVPSSCRYVKLMFPEISSYGNNIALVQGSSGAYKPYKATSTITLPSLTLKGVGPACDTYLPSTGKVQRKVGSIDLGSLTWDAYGSRMYANINGVVSDTSNILSDRLTKASWGDSGEVANTMVMSGTTLYANNNGYTDASAFKTAMSGVMLYYELATSTEETSTTIESTPIRVEEGGTLTLNSGVAQAEGVFGIDSINIMDGLTEVQIEADNCLSWEDHEEDTSNGILALPSTEIAEWAEVEKVEGKTVSVDGTLYSSTLSKVVSEGANLWDEEWEVGGINDTTGEKKDTSAQIRSKNYIRVEPSKTYYVYAPSGSGKVYTYSEEKTFIEIACNFINGATFTASASTRYIMFRCGVSYGNTYNSDIAIIKGTSGTYTAYSSSSLTLPSLTLKGVGSACDTYTPSTGKVQRKVKTLSSSAWAYDSGWGAWRLRNVDISPTNSGSEAPSLISSYYTVTPYSSGFSDKCLTAFNSLGSSLLIKDSDYTSDQAEAFNTHMAEVTILYPTTSPTEETSTTIDPYIAVEAGGSVSVVSTSAQAEATIHYLS